MNRALIKMSAISLKGNKLRTILTTLGIFIGTAIVIIVLSVGAGIEALVLEQMSSVSSETLWVEIQVPSNLEGRAKDANTATSIVAGVEVKTLTLDDIEDLRGLENVQNAYGMIMNQQKISYGSTEKNTMFWAVEGDYPKVESIDLAQGRFFTVQEDKNLEKVVVLGSDVARTLFKNRAPLNQKIKIGEHNYRVIGVADDIGAKFFMNMDELVYLPIRTTQKFILGIDHIQAIAIDMKDSEEIYKTIQLVAKTLRSNHNIKDPNKDDFAIRTQEESMEIIGAVTGGIQILLFLLAIISLVVGGVGIMNVMYVSVSERTNEIGLRKALGAKPSTIKAQFILEAVLVSLIGAFLGLLAGVSISWLISVVATKLGFNWPFVLSIYEALISFSLAVVLGIVFGYAPAKKAALMNPIEALRHS